MTVEDDGPYESEDDGGPSFDDIWDVYVHQFDLHRPDTTNIIKQTAYRCHVSFWGFIRVFFFCANLQTFSWESSVLSQCWPSAGRPHGPFVFSVEKNYNSSFIVINYIHFSIFILLLFFLLFTSPNSQAHCRKLTIGWPLITSSRSSSCDPSLRSEKRSDTNEGGHLCNTAHNSDLLISLSRCTIQRN